MYLFSFSGSGITGMIPVNKSTFASIDNLFVFLVANVKRSVVYRNVCKEIVDT